MTATPWALGDFHVIGAAQTLVSELLCDDVDLGAGAHVLDVACGSGNTALAAARRRTSVTGLDLVETLLERARARTASEGFSIEYVAGNAERLPFPDASFDVVLSTFGVMFAPDQARAANELLRVCKPGGTIGMANWTPESLPGALFALTARYTPPPPQSTPPIAWGTVPGLQRLFDGKIAAMHLLDRCVRHRFNSVDDWITTFRTYFGPIKNAFDTLEPARRDEYDAELRETVLRYNRATDGRLALAMTYVNVIITK